MESFSVTLNGFEMLEKEVKESGNSGRVFVPKTWIGKKVRIILLEPIEPVQ